MGLRFHKSFKIAPGLKLNLNKKSISLTGGVRGAHYTVSSSGKRTASVGIPGTGLSYVKNFGTKKSRKKSGEKKESSGKNSRILPGILITVVIIMLFIIILLLGRIAGII